MFFKWLLERLFTGIGAYASVAQVTGNNLNHPLNTLTIIVVACYLLYEIKEWQAKRPIVYKVGDPKQQEKINNFMLEWIKQGQKIAIFSNDMSWVNDASEVKALLLEKSKDDEVELFLPKPNKLSNELARKGATVYSYDKDFEPKIRFTVIHRNRDDARVAIGRRNLETGDFHIQKYVMGVDPTCTLAIDLLEVIRRRMNNADSVHK